MPWRKYSSNKGKYGNIYMITKGINVRYDRNDKWIIQININGLRKVKTIGPGRDNLKKAIKIAEKTAEKFADYRYSQDFGKRIHEKKERNKNLNLIPTFREFAKEWLEGNRSKWEDETYTRYEISLRRQILTHDIFDCKLCEIEKKDIKAVLRDIFKTHASKTVELAHIIINSIYKEAIEDFKEVKDNPSSGLLTMILPPVKKRKKKKPLPFTIDERDLFLKTAENNLKGGLTLVFKCMVYMGLRLGEALAMKANNIDSFKRTYYVQEQYKKHIFKDYTKNGLDRFVNMPDFLIDDLNYHISNLKKEGQSNGSGSDIKYLFLDPEKNDNFPYSQRKVYYHCQKICKSCGLRPRKNHDLRHTYASMLLMNHLSLEYVKNQLGHSSIEMTSSTYSHWIPGEGRENLEAALTKKLSKNAKKCETYLG